MHTEMWLNPATVANVATLRSRGISVLDPASGRLTGQDSGPGRLPEADEIIAAAFKLVRPQDLSGRTVVITAGGTQEPIDPVRYIGNRSSGKQGIALAKAAQARGAHTVLVAANLDNLTDKFDDVIAVNTAAEMLSAVHDRLATTDVLIMAAAVSDFRVAEVSASKLKRGELGDEIELHLIANPDILKAAASRVSAENLVALTIGFAAETAGSEQALLGLAETKLAAKGCDILVANDVSDGEVFAKDTNSVIIATKDGARDFARGTKDLVAERIIDAAVAALKS
jgi:phosphopantothenoylcysteine decarboxylase/phosphopantothenate--cysteine ligase